MSNPIPQAFVDELSALINKYSLENHSNTPDFILAAHLANCLVAYCNTITERRRWYVEDTSRGALAPARAEDPEYLDVRKFQTKFNQVAAYKPVVLSGRLAQERLSFMHEELREFAEGVNKGDLAEIADALIDLVYVAKGTAVMYGLPWRDLWDDVQRANMAKVPKVTHRGTAHDVGKPEGWVPPHTKAILAHHGFDEQTSWYGVDYPEHGAAYQGRNGWVKVSNGEELMPLDEAQQQRQEELAQQLSARGNDDVPPPPPYVPENPIGGEER